MKRARIERVLRVCGLQEEIARAAWLELERARAAAEENGARGIQSARDERTALGLRMEERKVSPGEILTTHAAIDGIEAHARSWRERARTLGFQARQARAPWEERRRDVRALEKLRDRARALESHEAFKKEAATLDEVAQRRAAESKQATTRDDAPRRVDGTNRT